MRRAWSEALRRTHVILVGALTVSALAFLAFATSASAAFASAPGDFSAADQYVESVPSTSGPKRPSAPGAKQPLAASLRARLGSGPTAARLNEVATSTQLGAPQEKLRTGSSRSSTSVPSAAVSVVEGNDGGGRLIWLLLAVLLLTALAAGKVGHRHYGNRKPSARR